jgi:outer membrane protein assembly factor BamB
VRRGLTVLLALALAGCAGLDALNPFAGGAAKLPPLPAIEPRATLAPVWRAEIGPAGDYGLVPATVGGSVFAASRDGVVVRFDDGREVWRVDLKQTLSAGVGADTARVVVGTPKGEVIALDHAGSVAWKARVSSEVLAAPALQGDLVLVRSGDSRVTALEAASGKRRWVYQRSTPPLALRGAAGVAALEGAAIVGFPGGKLVAINLANGAAAWEASVAVPRGATELERVADVVGIAVVRGRQVCAVAYQGRVGCFDLTGGNALWVREVSSDVGLDADERQVYVVDEKGVVQAFDRGGGASVWKQDRLAGRDLSRPAVAGRYVVLVDAEGVVHALDREDGQFAARYATDGSGIAGEPRAAGDAVLVQTRRGGLYLLAPR